MSKRDYYEILGLNKDASRDEINSAFRRLARQFHPDVSTDPDAENKFKEINEAKEVLLDDQKRTAYDQYGHAGVNRAGGVPDYSNMDFSSIFEEIFNAGFGGGFGFGGSRRGNSRNMPRKGYDLQYNLILEFEEAVFGVEKEISITRNEVCIHCDGDGAEPGTNKTNCPTCDGVGEVRQSRQTILGPITQVITCPTCSGQGKITDVPCKQCSGKGLEQKTVSKKVNIPAGISSGMQIRLSGEGQPGSNGGPNGDVYIAVRVKDHKIFRRNDYDILLDLNINVVQATLGAELEVPTVHGDHKLSIPPGTQPGKMIRMRNKGIPVLRGNGHGDQLVMVNVNIPKKLTDEQVELFEKLAESMGSEVNYEEKGILDSLRDFFNG